MNVTGSCHCGAIAYRADADVSRVTICHCSDCQNLTGTAYRVTVPAPAGTFELLRGTPKVYIKRGDSGKRRAHTFCPECASHLYSYAADADPVVSYGLRVGALAERRELVPRKRIWCGSELPWSIDVAGVPGRPAE